MFIVRGCLIWSFCLLVFCARQISASTYEAEHAGDLIGIPEVVRRQLFRGPQQRSVSDSPSRSTNGSDSSKIWEQASAHTRRQTLSAAKHRPGQGHGRRRLARPTNSTITPKNSTVPEWVLFQNVLMRSNTELLLYASDDDAAQRLREQIPDMEQSLKHQWWKRREWPPEDLQVTVVPPSALTEYPDTCYRWVEQPAIWFSVIDIDHVNFYHYLMDDLVPLVYTATIRGWFNLDAFMARKHLPTSHEAHLIIMQNMPWSLTAPLYWLLPHLTPDIVVADQLIGSCFRNLNVGVDSSPRAYIPTQDDTILQRRKDAISTFRQFAIEAALRTHTLRNWPRLKFYSRGAGGRKRIGWISRRRTAYGGGSRAVINEAEVVQALQERYDVDVSMLHFNATLGEAMVATQGLDVLIGVHGAGMTNLLWMEPGAVVVQLLPYGWESDIEGDYPNASLFQLMAESNSLTHLIWANKDPQNAYFTKSDFTDEAQYVEHPDESTPIPREQWRLRQGVPRIWQYQDTVVALDSFFLVIDKAMQLVGGNLRLPASST